MRSFAKKRNRFARFRPRTLRLTQVRYGRLQAVREGLPDFFVAHVGSFQIVLLVHFRQPVNDGSGA